jgi:translation initiation factor IF-2
LGKQLKLNIKNTQLAEAFKIQKSSDSVETKEKKSSPKEQKPATPTPEPQKALPEAGEAKKKLSKLKEESALPSPPKVQEKEAEAAAAAALPKRKARIMKESPDALKPLVDSPSQELAEAPLSVESSKEWAEPQLPSSPVKKEETTPPTKEASQPSSSATPPREVPRTGVSKPPESPKKADVFTPPRSPAKELRPKLKKEESRFDARDRQGLRDVDNEAWRKRRQHKSMKKSFQEEIVIRPKELHVRLPVLVKDLAQEMKLKASQLIAKLFMKGITLTINDYLDDETVVQLLGHDFDCEISIDTSEEQRIRITDQTIKQEIEKSAPEALLLRSPVITFMGHVDHGKTSLIDAIRKSNRVSSEAGAITQHIGAFKVKTPAGEVTILDTPGHEAFSEMRSRGANVTDIVILVVAGDEGIRAQTEEAIRQAKEASVPILVAINKSDKPNFDAQKVYRDLADRELLPEAWGGTTITVNCSAVSGQGLQELLEMVAIQAEILELKANPNMRARGTILESEMHKGLGAAATVLIQNGTLRKGDAIVFGSNFGRVKTMQDDHQTFIESAGPSVPVKITGLSEMAPAGFEFIVVKSEKEARELAAARAEGDVRTAQMQIKISSLDKMMAKRESGEMKILPLVLRADVQGSLEALRNSLMKIQSKKVRLEIVNAGVGEISESDISLAAASKATIIGFHTRIESHADDLIKEKKVAIISKDVIYHLVDEVREKMKSLLDKIEKEEELGAAIVKAAFKSSQLGVIAGCQVTEGIIKRQSLLRQVRGKEVVWKGKIASLKRVKEDVKEVKEGLECGILLDGNSDVREGDVLQAYEITYLEQEL